MGDDDRGWPLGRADEAVRLSACIDRVIDGLGDAVVVRGEVGIGVTTLLDALCSLAVSSDVAVIRATCRTAEHDVDGALLHTLAGRSGHGRFTRAVLGSASGTPTVVDLAEALLDVDEPTIVVVDDCHVADASSLRTLLFAAHRCHDRRVAVVLGGRAANWGADDGGLDRVDVVGLDAGSLCLLAAQASRSYVSRDVAVELHRRTGGNPLATVEIVRRLGTSQLDGTDDLPLEVAAGGSIGEVFLAPLRELDDDARRALFVAAAEPSGDLRTIGIALATLGDGVDALEPAEEAGVIELIDGAVVFDHPLRRAAAYQLIAAPSRRTAHRALALACDRPSDGERRLAHLDYAAVAPDEAIATDMEHFARGLEHAGERGRAARWWARAATLSPSPSDAQRRDRRAAAARSGHDDPLEALTPAERRVADAVGSGLANKEAAAALHVSVKTVDAHLQAIYRKLSIRSRTELALVVSRSTAISEVSA